MTVPLSAPQPLTPLDHALLWAREGHAVALATVVGTWGSSPRPAGSLMAISDTGRVEGSVSGGCVETDVITAAQAIMAGAPPEVLSYGVSSARAWEVGLACGGKLDVLVEAVHSPACPSGTLPEALLAEACAKQTARTGALLARTLDGVKHLLISDLTTESTPPGFPAELIPAALACLNSGRCRNEPDAQGMDWFLQPLTPPPRLLIVGAVHIAQHLALMARMTGFSPVVIDPRTALATPERFPGFILGETLLTEWPDDALGELGVDNMTAIVTLTHDAKLDDPTLEVALRSPAFYVGALGSRTTQASRVERLREIGFSEQETSRIHGPVGLAIGAIGAEEIALSILAQIVAVRRKAALANNPGW
ncbi:xanthine dehydrogenase accessory factor XdhC/CoxI [Acetobacter malorum DSM 14337]|uniref:Xanthine dehydrogenase accessory factor XdhC/CoxI n=1 Tax=Acetobacter malorum DSM 14337 TaxID=1307910 RepID=A0ABQ0PNQ3_9PROT|nr:XdhC family protein [Acetobacter malorum]KXV06690.1 xanthine dehydrogenase [Acetobacter malorum]GBQ76773.1 xanthine dehydrogenase accessory factor XdhC/CoxI [Acetobacter malorum DSM 14337]